MDSEEMRLTDTGGASKAQTWNTHGVSAMSGNSREEENPGAGSRLWVSWGRGGATACKTLMTWERMWAFSLLQGKPMIGLLVFDKSGLSGLQSSKSQVRPV